ncbi:MAG: RNA polymerase sigma factor [Planctomycetota bacterium]|jgi:RNA polymerase sigma-70 factor (ECF subfamily)
MVEDATSIYLQQWHSGDQQAFDALIERHLTWIHKKVHHRLGSMLREKGDTCDYVQDAVVQFLQYGPRFTISNDARFRGLLLKIVENVLCNKYDWFTARRRAIARERPLPSDTILSLDPPQQQIHTPSKSAEKHEQEAWVRLGIEFLKPNDREILILREWDGLGYEEIAQRLEITVNAATVRHLRAVRNLAEEVDKLRQGEGDPGPAS